MPRYRAAHVGTPVRRVRDVERSGEWVGEGAHRAPTRGARRRRPAPRQSGRALPAGAMIGALAVLAAAAGTVVVGGPAPAADTHGIAAYAPSRAGVGVQGDRAGGGLRMGPSDGLYSRSLTRPSRAGARDLAQQTAARAQARSRQLESAMNAADGYAKTVAREWVLPTSGFHITVWFGERGYYWSGGYHTGIDFATACGTPAVAVAAGTVARAGWDGPYGNQVRLTLANGDQVWYNHLLEIQTHAGAHLAQGDRIGLVGETGNAYGCHLHFEYRRAADLDTPVDPAPYFAAHGIRLH